MRTCRVCGVAKDMDGFSIERRVRKRIGMIVTERRKVCRDCDSARRHERFASDESFRIKERAVGKRWRDRTSRLLDRWCQKTAARLRGKSRDRGLPLSDITEFDIMDAMPPDGKCPVLGMDLVFSLGKGEPNGASIDRIVPELGYVKGNIAVISVKANRLKNNATLDDLEKLCIWMRKVQSVNNGR